MGHLKSGAFQVNCCGSYFPKITVLEKWELAAI